MTTTNSKKAEVPLELGGKVYVLKYDMNALAELEDDFGEPIHVFMRTFAGKFGISVLRKLLWYGLKTQHPELEAKETVGLLLDPQDMAVYGKAIGRALSLAVSGKEPEQVASEKKSDGGDPDGDPPPAQTGTGTSS